MDSASAVGSCGQTAGKKYLLVFVKSAHALDACKNLLKLVWLVFRAFHIDIMPQNCPGASLRHRHLAHARGKVINLIHRLEADIEDMHAAQAQGKFHRFIPAGVIME